MAYDDDDGAGQHNSPLVPWILVVAASILGVGASFTFYTRCESATALLKTAKVAADDYRQKAATAEGARAALEQQLQDATSKLKSCGSDKDALTARNTDLTNQLTQAQTSLAPSKGKKGAAAVRRKHHR